MCIPYGQTTIGVLSKVKQNVLNDFINTVCQCCMSFFLIDLLHRQFIQNVQR